MCVAVPNLILPPLLGRSLAHWPGGKDLAYREMFLGAALFQFLGALLVLTIDLPSNVKEGQGLRPWLAVQWRRCTRGGGRSRPPLGVRLCDGLCFGAASQRVARMHDRTRATRLMRTPARLRVSSTR